jgi:hypothetical protein
VAFGIMENSPRGFGLNQAVLPDGLDRGVQIGDPKKEDRFIFRYNATPLRSRQMNPPSLSRGCGGHPARRKD